MVKKSSGAGRTRNYAAIVYPDSAPEFWQGILAEQAIPAFISPLHDKDLNPTGESKKPHYHVMLMFEGVKSIEQAEQVFDLINGVGCTKINSVRGYARYLVHADNPEKAQYSVSDVISLCGADYIAATALQSDKYIAISEMIDFIEDNNFFSYSKFLVYCKNNRQDWFRCLCDSSTLVIKEFLKSRKWDSDEEKRKNDFENRS